MTGASLFALKAVASVALAVSGLTLFTGWMARRARLAVPPIGEFRELDGNILHFTDRGPRHTSSPPIVMIHGLGGTMRGFTYALVEELCTQYRVITIDRPGSGYSTRPDDRASIKHQATLLADFIAALGVQHPLIVGHSFGGAIALAMALNHPERVAGLALLAPLTHAQTSVPGPFRGLQIQSRWLRWLVGWTLAVPVGLWQGDAALIEIFGPDPVPADFGTRGGGRLGLRPRAFYGMSTDLMSIGDELQELPARYAGLTQPTGVLFGTADQVLDVQLHGVSMAEKVAGLHLELIEGGGHMIPLVAPGRTAAFIRHMAQATEARLAAWPLPPL